MSRVAYLPLLLTPLRGTVRAFPTVVGTMPSADFCRTVRETHISLSRDFATCGSSPEVSTTAFNAQPPDLRLTPWMDMDFAINRSLVRRSRLISGFCSSARAFARRFLQTFRPLRSATLHLHQVGGRLSLPSCRTCSAHGARRKQACALPRPASYAQAVATLSRAGTALISHWRRARRAPWTAAACCRLEPSNAYHGPLHPSGTGVGKTDVFMLVDGL